MSGLRRGAGYSSGNTALGGPGAFPGAPTSAALTPGLPIPNLPGNRPYVFQEWQRPKQQRCTVMKGVAGVYDEKFDKVTGVAEEALERAGLPPPPSSRAPRDASDYQKIYPPWVAFDRKVLRFHAFFRETVPESPSENARVRRGTILFYLEDGTLQILEPRESNSGIAQGTFLKRHKVAKGRSAEFIDVEDLNVGVDLEIYGRCFHVYACDGATRAFLEREGRQVPEDQEPPVDQYHLLMQKKAGENQAKAEFRRMTNMKIKDANHKWTYLDKKVLRFFCSWDNRKNLYGDKMPYVLHYYLVDDTVDVAEVHLKNDGRDPWPMLLKRAPLPKYIYSVGGRPMSAGTRESMNYQYYHWKDLMVGKTVFVYGREMKLFDCDEFTRSWYKDHMDITMPTVEVNFGSKPHKYQHQIPDDALRIGREEDSRGNCLSLRPKPPRPNWAQFQNCSGQVMRFFAWLVHDPEHGTPLRHESDRDRRFIVSYFLADDTVAIFEPPMRNSGIIGGKFLERSVVRKPGSRTVKYMAKEFFEGARIFIHGRQFELGEPDLFTINYQEARTDMYPHADYERVIQRIGEHIHCEGLIDELKTTLIEADVDGTGQIQKHHLLIALQHIGVAVSPAEITTIARRLDENAHQIAALELLNELGCGGKGERPSPPVPESDAEGASRDHWRPGEQRKQPEARSSESITRPHPQLPAWAATPDNFDGQQLELPDGPTRQDHLWENDELPAPHRPQKPAWAEVVENEPPPIQAYPMDHSRNGSLTGGASMGFCAAGCDSRAGSRRSSRSGSMNARNQSHGLW